MREFSTRPRRYRDMNREYMNRERERQRDRDREKERERARESTQHNITVRRTHANIQDKDLCSNSHLLKAVNYYFKTLPLKYLLGS